MTDRQEIAGRHGIPHLANELTGDTAEALEADAAAKAAIVEMFGGEFNYPEPAKAEPAEPDAPVDEVQQMIAAQEKRKAEQAQHVEIPTNKYARQQLLTRLAHGLEPETNQDPQQHTTEQDATLPDFDGGTRETVTPPSDPEADHAALILDLVAKTNRGGNGGW